MNLFSVLEKKPHFGKSIANQKAVHASVTAMAKIKNLKFKLLPHAPYSPDKAPSDNFLFPNLKKMACY